MNEASIDLRVWRQFEAVADELHFGRAALRLHMTQPPLTQAIAGLEAALQVRLFDRTRRSVQLTPAGAALLPEVRDLLARAGALPGHARAAAAGELGRLRLAFVSTVGFDLLPRWVRAFREQSPGVALELIAGLNQKGDGPDGDPLGCKMARPHGVFCDADGTVFVGESESHRVRLLRRK